MRRYRDQQHSVAFPECNPGTIRRKGIDNTTRVSFEERRPRETRDRRRCTQPSTGQTTENRAPTKRATTYTSRNKKQNNIGVQPPTPFEREEASSLLYRNCPSPPPSPYYLLFLRRDKVSTTLYFRRVVCVSVFYFLSLT